MAKTKIVPKPVKVAILPKSTPVTLTKRDTALATETTTDDTEVSTNESTTNSKASKSKTINPDTIYTISDDIMYNGSPIPKGTRQPGSYWLNLRGEIDNPNWTSLLK